MPAYHRRNRMLNGGGGVYVSEEQRSLLSMRNFHSKKPKSFFKRIGGCTTIGMVIISLATGFLMGFDQTSTNNIHQSAAMMMIKGGGGRKFANTSPLELLAFVHKTKKTIISQQLRQEYGDYTNILLDKSALRSIFRFLNHGNERRYRRRIQRKILQKKQSPWKSISFTWVTAGDYRATGLGNAPEHSYTDIIRQTIQSTFGSVGLDVVTKNRAVVEHNNGPSLALCMESVYGNDIDILSWDFGHSDGGSGGGNDATFFYRSALWGIRALIHPSRPLLMTIDDSTRPRWQHLMKQVDGKMGLAMMDTTTLHEIIKKRFPDSDNNKQQEQLPDAVEYLQCNGILEGNYYCPNRPKQGFTCVAGGECGSHKFFPQDDKCRFTKYQTNWMPGWKEHRLKGRLIGLFLIDLLQDALMELDNLQQQFAHLPSEKSQTEALLKLLETYENQDEFVAMNSPIGRNILGKYSERMRDMMIPLFQRPANCELAMIDSAGGNNHLYPKKAIARRRKLQVLDTAQPNNETTNVTSGGSSNINTTITTIPEATDTKNETTAIIELHDEVEGKKEEMVISDDTSKSEDSSGEEEDDEVTEEKHTTENRTAVQHEQEKGKEKEEENKEEMTIQVSDDLGVQEEKEPSPGDKGQEDNIAPPSEGEKVTISFETSQTPRKESNNNVTTLEIIEGDSSSTGTTIAVAGTIVDATQTAQQQMATPQDNHHGVVDDIFDPGNSTDSDGGGKVSLKDDGAISIIATDEESSSPEQCKKVHPQHKHAFQVVHQGGQFDIKILSNGDSYLMACFQSCTFGECHETMEGLDSVKVSSGNIVIMVDELPVTATHEMDGCHFLEGENGLLWKTPRDRFTLRFSVTEEGGALLLFSVLAL